jgi:hypothetical protein
LIFLFAKLKGANTKDTSCFLWWNKIIRQHTNVIISANGSVNQTPFIPQKTEKTIRPIATKTIPLLEAIMMEATAFPNAV